MTCFLSGLNWKLIFFFQAEDGIRDRSPSRGLGDVYKRQESCIERVSLASFAAARALSTHYNETPERASRPFDINRDGFVMSEGAAVLVVEALDHALARGAAPLAELVGYGTTSDAYHMAAAPPDGEGLQRCMRFAIDAAGVKPSEVGYIDAAWRCRRTHGNPRRVQRRAGFYLLDKISDWSSARRGGRSRRDFHDRR